MTCSPFPASGCAIHGGDEWGDVLVTSSAAGLPSCGYSSTAGRVVESRPRRKKGGTMNGRAWAALAMLVWVLIAACGGEPPTMGSTGPPPAAATTTPASPITTRTPTTNVATSPAARATITTTTATTRRTTTMTTARTTTVAGVPAQPGQTVTLPGSNQAAAFRATIVGVDEHQELPPPYGSGGPTKARGKFVVLSLDIENTGTQSGYVDIYSVKLRDGAGRTFDAASSEAQRGADQLTGRTSVFQAVQPGLTADIVLVFDVAPNAERFTLIPRAR